MSSGGTREGAGRPKKPDKKVTIAVRVKPETKQVIDKLSARQKIRPSKLVARLIEEGLKG